MLKPTRDLIVLGGIVLIVLIIFAWALHDATKTNDAKAAYCREHGGTYFVREGKCINVQEIQIP